MARIAILVSSGIVALLAAGGLALSPQAPLPRPFTRPLECPEGYCRLLEGAPQTSGMRSGFVRLKPGESIGEHTTGDNEESLVVLRGQGEARIEGHDALAFAAPALVYVPIASRHNVVNTGTEPLEYVFVVAPRCERAAQSPTGPGKTKGGPPDPPLSTISEHRIEPGDY